MVVEFDLDLSFDRFQFSHMGVDFETSDSRLVTQWSKFGFLVDSSFNDMDVIFLVPC